MPLQVIARLHFSAARHRHTMPQLFRTHPCPAVAAMRHAPPFPHDTPQRPTIATQSFTPLCLTVAWPNTAPLFHNIAEHCLSSALQNNSVPFHRCPTRRIAVASRCFTKRCHRMTPLSIAITYRLISPPCSSSAVPSFAFPEHYNAFPSPHRSVQYLCAATLSSSIAIPIPALPPHSDTLPYLHLAKRKAGVTHSRQSLFRCRPVLPRRTDPCRCYATGQDREAHHNSAIHEPTPADRPFRCSSS